MDDSRGSLVIMLDQIKSMLDQITSRLSLDDINMYLVLVLILLISRSIWQRMTTRLPPGPTSLPLVGNLLAVKRNTSKVPLWIYLKGIAHQYGNVMTIHFGPKAMVILNTNEAIKHAFLDKATEFAGRPWTMIGEVGLEGCADVTFAPWGPGWGIRRRILMVALKKFGDKNTVAHLVMENTIEACEDMLKENKETGKVAQVKLKLYLVIYNTIVSMLFGKKFAMDDEDFVMLKKNKEEFNQFLGARFLADFFPFLKCVPTATTKKIKELVKESQDYFKKQLADHERTLDEENPRDICDAMIMARDQMRRERAENIHLFKDVNLRRTMGDILVAGTETTCFTIHWAILFCMHHPELQDKVHAEIAAKIGTRRVVADDKRKLPYTDAFILEVMRIRPVGPVGVPHCTTSDTNLYGYEIPKGTLVLSNIWAAQHDPELFPHPSEFIPDRFINQDTGAVIMKPEGFLAFSIGKRVCAGEGLARVDTFLIFATLIQNLKFSALDPDNLPTLIPDLGLAKATFCGAQHYDMKVESW